MSTMEDKTSRGPIRACSIEAPCKINLHLKIGEKRPDGYHSLESLFASLALADSLRFEVSGREAECRLSMEWDIGPEGSPASQAQAEQSHQAQQTHFEQIPPEKNLVYRAVSLFRERTGYEAGLGIHLIKRIPPGAGLGGGSSDAASTLLALDKLAGTGLGSRELMEMALLLGSDVPFFLKGGSAYVSGRGEIIEPVKSPAGLWVVLVKPGFSSNTAAAFRLLEEARAGSPAALAPSASGTEPLGQEKGGKPAKNELVNAFLNDPVSWPFSNDFLEVFLKSEKTAGVFRSLLEKFQKTGALFAGLSGSGSCCFGIYGLREAAERSLKEFEGNFAKLTIFLAQKANPVVK